MYNVFLVSEKKSQSRSVDIEGTGTPEPWTEDNSVATTH